jgi:DNA-binding HxlR family transcriptional regulator
MFVCGDDSGQKSIVLELVAEIGFEAIACKVHPVVPPKVEYSLTPYGRTLRRITDVMCEWGMKHLRRR